MLSRREELGHGGFWLGVAILLVGIAIGRLAKPEEWSLDSDLASGASERGERAALHPLLRPPDETAGARARSALDTLALSIPEESAQVLQSVRDRAMQRGVIVQADEDTVPAVVGFEGKSIDAEIRIKGDWLDHVRSDKWSLRIKLKRDKLLGMSTFSIQAPETRGMMWEWFVLAAARREGVLAPRSTFVNVEINGRAAGIYYLEEHFTKELLESQGRREGPIVRWDESTHWSKRLQSHRIVDLGGPATGGDGMDLSVATVRAFGEKRLSESETLSRALYSATEKMRDLRTVLSSTGAWDDRSWLLKEMNSLDDASIESLVDVDLMARAHALASIFQVQHAHAWHNLRFYHDPVRDRLEPIVFDNMAQNASDPMPVMHRSSGVTRELTRNQAYFNAVFRYLGEYCEPAWIDDLVAELGPELLEYEAALESEAPLATTNTVAGMTQRLRAEQGFLRRIIYPDDALNVEAYYELDPSNSVLSGSLEVLAWATSHSPIVVEGFRFSNGGFVPAGPNLIGAAHGGVPEGTGFVLPTNGASVRFRFPIDERLASLESAREIKRAIRDRVSPPQSLDFDVDLVYRPIAADETRSELLSFRRFDASWAAERGRPAAPSLEEALRHPFLELALETQELRVKPGTWNVEGDLILPRGKMLHMRAGTTLRFEADAVLVTDGALRFTGSKEEPIVLEPVAGAESWRGIVVLDTDDRSILEHVVIRSTDAVTRRGWIVTGGITFYRSTVQMRDCLIEGTHAEDGLNIFGTVFDLERVTFSGCRSDSFDGDFVSGRIVACVFRDGLADGVDFSGSDVELVDCVFERLGDKAISVGEDTVARVSGAQIDGCLIGVAAKDRSRVVIRNSSIRGALSYALAAFVKKAEFGPSTLTATDVRIESSGIGDALAQTGCRVVVDGTKIETQDLDVKRLYADGILGR